MKVNILGTEYLVERRAESQDAALKECGGYCDETAKACIIKDYLESEREVMDKKNMELQLRKNTRHEIIHAFLFESGLGEDSDWALTEEMVDWFARQFPKLLKAFQDANAM
ncbi:MAG: hypothetical protein AAGU75_10625 [Bacillota bacterium]